MWNASRSSPENPHFFQPLLPGIQSHLNIPLKFFSEYIKGKHEGKTVKLMSDSSRKTWKVKMEGQRLTQGWKEFVEAHDLRVGDLVVFRHEGDMLFHVSTLGPSCCEIQYTPSQSQNEESDETGESSREEEKIVENEISEFDHSSSDLNIFSQSVTASNLSRDTVRVPMDFASRNRFNEGRHEIVLMNEQGESWKSEVKSWNSCEVFIFRGWTIFCTENKLQVGDSCTFKLHQNTEKPVFQLCSRAKAERKNEILSEEDSTVGRENRFVKLTLTPNSLRLGKQHLPVSFTRVNMLNKPSKIILVDKNGKEWSMELKVDNSRETMYIMSGKGWKSFCSANEVEARESLALELIGGGTSPLLKFSSKMEQSPVEADAHTQKRARLQRWSQETRPKTAEEGETSHCTKASNKSSAEQGNVLHTQPCSVSDQVAKVKQSVVDTLISIKRILAELKTMEHKLEDSLQEINNICMMCNLISDYINL